MANSVDHNETTSYVPLILDFLSFAQASRLVSQTERINVNITIRHLYIMQLPLQFHQKCLSTMCRTRSNVSLLLDSIYIVSLLASTF